MDEITVKACAKINLYLDITSRESSGYHLIDSVMCSADIGDIITVKKSGGGDIEIFCEGVEKHNNTAYIAARLFKQKYSAGSFDIYITKNIPFCSGLGGSSADAAGVLFCLCRLFGIELSDVRDICFKCGSDVLYMLTTGGFARVTGKGEIITPFECPHTYNIVIAKPEGGVNSGDAYGEYDNNPQKQKYNAEKVINAIKQKDIDLLAENCHNALYYGACKILPQIKDVINILKQFTPAAFMTGSGSACAGVFKNNEDAQICTRKLIQQGYFAISTKTLYRGIYII